MRGRVPLQQRRLYRVTLTQTEVRKPHKMRMGRSTRARACKRSSRRTKGSRSWVVRECHMPPRQRTRSSPSSSSTGPRAPVWKRGGPWRMNPRPMRRPQPPSWQTFGGRREALEQQQRLGELCQVGRRQGQQCQWRPCQRDQYCSSSSSSRTLAYLVVWMASPRGHRRKVPSKPAETRSMGHGIPLQGWLLQGVVALVVMVAY
mmetsp:Transcript_3210/g.8522  ORF Transcript_3210/g.8522 Transcript_3210/m.8522 type:complete len:203 (+) Transcript_3210:1445-2053(+)